MRYLSTSNKSFNDRILLSLPYSRRRRRQQQQRIHQLTNSWFNIVTLVFIRLCHTHSYFLHAPGLGPETKSMPVTLLFSSTFDIRTFIPSQKKRLDLFFFFCIKRKHEKKPTSRKRFFVCVTYYPTMQPTKNYFWVESYFVVIFSWVFFLQ